MSNYKHNTIIVVGHMQPKELELARSRAIEIGLYPVSKILDYKWNGFQSFVIPPHGMKTDTDECLIELSKRDKFKDFLTNWKNGVHGELDHLSYRDHLNLEWIAVTFGGDDLIGNGRNIVTTETPGR